MCESVQYNSYHLIMQNTQNTGIKVNHRPLFSKSQIPLRALQF